MGHCNWPIGIYLILLLPHIFLQFQPLSNTYILFIPHPTTGVGGWGAGGYDVLFVIESIVFVIEIITFIKIPLKINCDL